MRLPETCWPRLYSGALLLRSVLCVALVLSCAGPSVAFQDSRTDDPAPAEEGLRLYRSRCAVCHGINAEGYRGPALTTGTWKHGGSDSDLFVVIRDGIPETEMGGSSLSDSEIRSVIAYLRTLNGPARIDGGNAPNGESLFFGKANCANCHSLGGRGGRFGPDLTFAARARSRTALIRAIRNASEVVPEGYEQVVVVTNEGERVGGLRKNEDAFSIQMLDANRELRAFLKTELRDVISESKSLMPDYGPDRLTATELDDILQFLAEAAGLGGGGE